MGVNSNNSSQVVVASGTKWTGVTNMKVTAINPTKAEMEKMGMHPKDEPNYFIEKDGRTSYRVDIYLNNAENKINAKAAFFLEAKPRTDKTGTKTQYINKFGQTGWSSDNGATVSNNFYKQDGSRPAIIGEENLVAFISAWANVDQNGQAVLDDPMALAKGNLSEIKSLFAAIANNEVRVLLGVREGKYQDVYTQYFARPYQKDYAALQKKLESQYGKFESDFQNDFRLRQYEGGKINLDAPTDMSEPSTNTGGGAPAYNF